MRAVRWWMLQFLGCQVTSPVAPWKKPSFSDLFVLLQELSKAATSKLDHRYVREVAKLHLCFEWAMPIMLLAEKGIWQFAVTDNPLQLAAAKFFGSHCLFGC